MAVVARSFPNRSISLILSVSHRRMAFASSSVTGSLPADASAASVFLSSVRVPSRSKVTHEPANGGFMIHLILDLPARSTRSA